MRKMRCNHNRVCLSFRHGRCTKDELGAVVGLVGVFQTGAEQEQAQGSPAAADLDCCSASVEPTVRRRRHHLPGGCHPLTWAHLLAALGRPL